MQQRTFKSGNPPSPLTGSLFSEPCSTSIVVELSFVYLIYALTHRSDNNEGECFYITKHPLKYLAQQNIDNIYLFITLQRIY